MFLINFVGGPMDGHQEMWPEKPKQDQRYLFNQVVVDKPEAVYVFRDGVFHAV